MAMAAARMAIEEAQLPDAALQSERAAIILGTAFGGMDTFEKQHLNFDKGKKVSPFTVPALLPNTGAGILAIELGCTGPNYGVVSACAAGSHAIGTALRQMQYGEVGCAEMRCCEGERLCRDAAEREALSRHFRDTAEA